MSPQDAVKALRESGLSEAVIARTVGCSQPTVHRIGKGQSCMWQTGQDLIALAREKLAGKKAESEHSEAA